MKVPIIWLSYKENTPPRGYWDHGIIEDLFSGKLWRPAGYNYEFEHHENVIPDSNGAVIVFPARAQTDMVDRLNADMARFKWVVLMLTGDEESQFPVEQIKHPNIYIYVMSPREGRHDKYRKLGTGYPPQAREWLPQWRDEAHRRKIDYFFAGQITHERRRDMQQAIETIEEFQHVNNLMGVFLPTKGFTQGDPPDLYYQQMADAKVAFAPSGPETPDSFRLFEALEAGCIPIADTRSPKGGFSDNYWRWFFGGDVPFPILTSYDQLQGFTIDAVSNWKQKSNRIFSWWQQKKRQFAHQVHMDIAMLSGQSGKQNMMKEVMTVVVPTSPIADHPSTEVIEKTISDIRMQLPDVEIIITIDGLRPEQSEYAEAYEEYKLRLLWLCNNKWTNVLPIVFDTHMHQSQMMHAVMASVVRTPTVMYVEHDAPITPDRIIEWNGLVTAIMDGRANVIRLHHEERILPDHEHLMYDTVPQGSPPMKRTMQWSQRPHIASSAFYRHILDSYFNPKSKTMIEDVMHGVVHAQCEREGVMGWNMFRLWVYTPDTDTLGIKRSYHLDARKDDPKYEMEIYEVEK